MASAPADLATLGKLLLQLRLKLVTSSRAGGAAKATRECEKVAEDVEAIAAQIEAGLPGIQLVASQVDELRGRSLTSFC
jgi:hypothetical protein